MNLLLLTDFFKLRERCMIEIENLLAKVHSFPNKLFNYWIFKALALVNQMLVLYNVKPLSLNKKIEVLSIFAVA